MSEQHDFLMKHSVEYTEKMKRHILDPLSQVTPPREGYHLMNMVHKFSELGEDELRIEAQRLLDDLNNRP